MPMDDLVGVIETLQHRIRDHGPTLRENETRTRMALIDPLLTALGWDVSDPALVTPEYGIGDDLVDYALLGFDNQPVALMEAKKLGASLRIHEKQLIGYCQKAGIGYGVLTDGGRWWLYDVSKANARLKDQIDVAVERPAHQVVMRLLKLWRPNLAYKPPELPAIPKPGAFAKPLPLNFPSPGWVALSSFNPPTGVPPPTSVRLPDGSVREVKNWRGLVAETIKWLWTKGWLTQNNIPVRNGPNTRRYIVNSEPVHGTGAKFNFPVAVDGTPLFFEANVGITAPSRARVLLEHCGVNPDTVQLQVGQ